MRAKSAVLGMAAAAAFSGAAFSALASPVPCATAALSTYLDATCTVLDKTISGMSLTVLSASAVTVDPVTVPNDPGLKFVLTGAGGATESATISFTIAAPSSDPMTDASLAVTGTGYASVAGSFGISETLSNGSLSASASGFNLGTITKSDSTTFTASATSLDVTDALSATNATLDSFTNQFSETPVTVPVPKPSPLASLALLGVGLSTLELARRRKRS